MWLVLSAALPGILVSGFLLWRHSVSPIVAAITLITLSLALVICTWLIRDKTRFPLRTISNLIAGIREGDFSIRARGGRSGDALGEVILEVNALCESLRQLRLGGIEATNLLHRVMDEINVAIFTFDESQRLRLVNRAGEQLLGKDSTSLLTRSANEVGLQPCLEGEPTRTIDTSLEGEWAGTACDVPSFVRTANRVN